MVSVPVTFRCWIFILAELFQIIFFLGVTGDRVGLAITQSLSLISYLQWGVRQSE